MRPLLVPVLILILLVGGLFTSTAQEDLPAFATNTPVPPALVRVTPAAAMNRYALRPWTAAAMQDVLAVYVAQLGSGSSEAQKTVRLLQYEMQRRFPGAPRDQVARQRLLNLMLAAPPGSVDMRALLRPSVETLLNQRGVTASGLADFQANGFSVEVTPADFDGQDPLDALLHVRYGTRYEEYLPAVASETGQWQVARLGSLPAVPLGDLQALDLVGLDDYNGDGLDDLVLSLDTGDVNRELRVFGWRGGGLADLVQPGTAIRYGGALDWTPGDALNVQVDRVEDPLWRCMGVQDVTWEWRGNLFRATPDPSGFYFDNTANCLFYGAEPLFAMPVNDALQSIREIMAYVPDDADFAGQRARVMQVMLTAFRGDTGSALALAMQLQTQAEAGSWLEQQAGALVSGLQQPDIHPLEICAALVALSPDGGCNVDDALGRILEEEPLRRDTPIAEQLAELGIHVQAQTKVSQVGMADREIVRFDMAGQHWWAFAPLDREFYRAEKTDPVPSMMPASAPLPVAVVPPNVYDALLVDNDPSAVLTALDNLLRENPQAAVSPELRYMQALSLDLLGDRSRARQAYFELWQGEALSIWGQLAAAHLEQR